MASPRPPEDLTTPSPSSGDQQDSPEGSVEGLQPPRGREKKKVGFASDNQPQTTSFPSSSYLTPDESQGAFQDYFSYTPSPYSNASTPRQGDGPARRDSFDREKVTAALTQILSSERESSPGPSKPRPVLRKPTALSSPVDLPTAPLRSEVEAKHRADRLAYSVGTASSPISRRPSFDFEHGTGEAPRDRSTASIAQDSEAAVNSDTIQPRKKAQLEADNLVRSHTRRKSPLIHSFAAPRSGTATPVEHDVDYVPQPDKYKGGILGTLLKLYSSEDRDRYGSQYADSSTPSTPGSTPPQSRPSTPKTEGRRRSWRPQSTSTLAGLMESSFMFAAPGSSGNISEAVSEKVKKEAEKNRKPSKSKKKLEEFRIKIHIAEIIKRHEYLIKLCKALMTYGAPTHRLEAYMRMSSRVLGIEGQFLYLPDTMIISFDDSNTHTTEVKILRASQGIDFGRLRDVHTIYKDVVHDRMGVEEATMRLHDVTERKAKFPVWFRIILYGIASAMVAPFGFEGRYIDMPICFILGCLVGFLQLYIAPSNELYNNVFEITAAVATSCLARAFGSIRGGSLFCFSSMAQSSIALILPGYMVLCASLELQSHQMISGSVRMVYALIYTLFLGYGFTIGSVIYGYMDKDAVSEVHCSVGDTWYTQRPPENFYLLFVFPFTLCLCFINQAKWKQTPVQVAISLAGFCVSNFSARFFKGNGIISSSLGALTIGVLANLYSRLGRHCQNFLYDMWERHVEPRVRRFSDHRDQSRHNRSPYYDLPAADESDDTIGAPKEHDLEMGRKPSSGILPRVRKVGYGLAAAAMLPAIFVQVPSGLAASGSLLSGVTSADQITRNETVLANGTVLSGTLTTTTQSDVDLNGTAFNVLYSVIQVAINISVGLSLSALLVYPFGKRRSGLFSF